MDLRVRLAGMPDIPTITSQAKSPAGRIEIPGAVVVETCFGVEFPSGVLERVCQRARRVLCVPERIERVRLGQRPCCVAQRSDGADADREDRARDALLHARQVQIGRRVVQDVMVAHQPAEPAAHRR